MLSGLQQLRNEAQQYRNEAQQYRNEMLMIRDALLIPQPFTVENYQGKISDDLSDDGIDIEEIIKIDNTDIDEEIEGKIDNADIYEKIKEIDDDDKIDIKEIIEIDNADIDEEIIEIDNDSKETIEIKDNDSEETIEVKDKRSIQIEMIKNQISQVNKFSLVRNMFARNTREIGKLMIELQEGNICDNRIYDDPWLKLNVLQKMNVLIDEAFDNAWRMIHDKDRKMHKKNRY